jgi:hypothetical protein
MAHVAWQPLLKTVFPSVPALVPVAYLSRGGLQAWFALQTEKKQVRTHVTRDLPYAWVAMCVCVCVPVLNGCAAVLTALLFLMRYALLAAQVVVAFRGTERDQTGVGLY